MSHMEVVTMEGLPQNLNLLRIQERIREERQAVKKRREMLLALENRNAMVMDIDKLAIVYQAEYLLKYGDLYA